MGFPSAKRILLNFLYDLQSHIILHAPHLLQTWQHSLLSTSIFMFKAKYTYQSSNLTSQDEFGAEVLLWLGFALSLGLALLQWLLATFFYIAVKLLTSKHF